MVERNSLGERGGKCGDENTSKDFRVRKGDMVNLKKWPTTAKSKTDRRAIDCRLGSRTSAKVIPTDEDLMIARYAWKQLNSEPTSLNPR